MALEGIKILDLSRLLPGPYCTLLLSDLGAEVIKIEEPGEGDYARWFPPFVGGISSMHLIVNRNKKSMTLNLKSEEGRRIFLKLAEKSDVILESFRPGVMHRLGLGYEIIQKINPRIIYCSLSGFGQSGPYMEVAAHDINYLAVGGILGLADPPSVPCVPIADLSGGLFAAFGILVALFEREGSGKGQFVDVSMLDGILSWMVDGAKYNFAGESISGGKKRFQGRLAHYSIYRTKDGKYLAVGALEKKFWRNLCMKIGREDLTEKQPSDESPREDVKNELQKIFLTLSRDEWVERLKDEDVCIAPVQTLDEVFSDPHVLHRKMVVEQTHPKIGKIRQLGIPVKFSRTPGSIRSPAPELGENTEEILLELGYGKDEIVSLREKGVI